MGFVSGLVSSFGLGAETTAGTPVTVNRHLEHVSESLKLEINRSQGEGLYGSTNGVALANRHVVTTLGVSGDVELECTSRSLGLLWRAATGGASTSTLTTGTVYEQVHQFGDMQQTGSSLTLQVGRPQTDGTIKPFTFNGAKVTSVSIDSNVNDPVNVTFGFDAWNQTTATSLATVSYVANKRQLTGQMLTVYYGGTASTTSGKVSVSGGTALNAVKGVTVSWDNPLATERFYAGSSGIKSEQVPNGYREVSVELDMDFADYDDVYQYFVANTSRPLRLLWQDQGQDIDTSGATQYETLEILLSSTKVTDAEVNVDGPDLLPQKVTLVGLFDGTNAPLQIRTLNNDVTL